MRGTIGERIKMRLNDLHITQKELAKQAGLTEAAVSHYIKGNRIPRATVLAKLAWALETTPDYLLNGSYNGLAEELVQAKNIIARNATQMTAEEKMEIMEILFGKDD